MPLPLPRLDDRDFDQLVEEVRNTLPALAPDWTDYNASDPGITLIELFAYLTEIGVYRLDRVPPSSRRAFVRLLGGEVEPARVARAVVSIDRQPGQGSVKLPRGVQMVTADAIAFQTTATLHVIDTALTTVLGVHAGRTTDLSVANASGTASFMPFGERPVVGDALYLGFDRAPAPKGAWMRLFVVGRSVRQDAELWAALAAEAKAMRQSRHRACGSRVARRIGAFSRHYSARLAWEYFDVAGEWRPLPHVRDRTRALTITGPAHIRVPDPARHAPGGIAGHAGTFFLRARLVSGEYDCPPEVRRICANAVVAAHAADVDASETAGVSFGHAHETYRLMRRPVVPGSSVITVTTGGGDVQTWREVRDWDRSGSFDRDYVLDDRRGEIAFGNGRYGAVPEAGATIRARYRVGAGESGNLRAGALVRLRDDGLNATIANWSTLSGSLRLSQVTAAVGGADAMTIDAAEGQLIRTLAHARAAVTRADLERIAMTVPGVPVARACAISETHPAATCLRASGCVTLVVVPACVDARRDPSEPFLQQVASAVDRRRPVATEVHVVGARYTTVIVRARLHLHPGGSAMVTPDGARRALDEFFHPLRGGPDGGGWPVGRSAYRSEVLALLMALPGVAYVSDLDVRACGDTAGRCSNVEICPDGLITSGRHRIEIA